MPISGCIDVYMDEIKKCLQKSCRYQRSHPDWLVTSTHYVIDSHPEYYSDDDYDIRYIFNGFTNCCFSINCGDEVFPGTLYDGKVHLMMELTFSEDEDERHRTSCSLS